MRRWQVVARLHVGCNSWIIPASKGRRRHRFWLSAWRDARALGKALGDLATTHPRMTWEVQRVYPRHKA